MGLQHRRDSALRQSLHDMAHWRVTAAIAFTCIVFAAFGDEGREVFKYDRLAIENGQYWRLVTAHFVHLGETHLLLNLAGLVLVWLLVGRYFSTPHWILVLMISISAVSVGFWFADQNLLWYVGLSGVLHGLLFAGAMQGLRSRPGESAILLLVVAAKLAYEQLAGPLPGSESVSGGDVVVNAHLFGALGGVVAAGVLWHSARDSRSI